MTVVTVSPKFQVVIPKGVREKLRLKPGQRLHAFVYDGRIELMPVETAASLRGFAAGMDTTLDRDDDRL